MGRGVFLAANSAREVHLPTYVLNNVFAHLSFALEKKMRGNKKEGPAFA